MNCAYKTEKARADNLSETLGTSGGRGGSKTQLWEVPPVSEKHQFPGTRLTSQGGDHPQGGDHRPPPRALIPPKGGDRLGGGGSGIDHPPDHPPNFCMIIGVRGDQELITPLG